MGRHRADNQYDGEAANHGDGTAVDRIDGVAKEHVDNCQAYAPYEASPYRGGGDALPIETQHEGSEESTCQRTSGDTHELGNEGGGIQGDEQGDGDEEHNQHTHHHYLTALYFLGYYIVDSSFLHFARQ